MRRVASSQGLLIVAALFFSSPVLAGWKLMPGKQRASIDSASVVPLTDWNQASARPGKQGRIWTKDGFDLNAFEVFNAVPNGAPLYKERDRKRNPMPKFDNAVLLPELADFFERSFRTNNQITDFTIIETAPANVGGYKGLRVRYKYTKPNDELTRFGEARLAVSKGKLYAINFYAPRLHYFADRIDEVQTMMESIRF